MEDSLIDLLDSLLTSMSASLFTFQCHDKQGILRNTKVGRNGEKWGEMPVARLRIILIYMKNGVAIDNQLKESKYWKRKEHSKVTIGESQLELSKYQIKVALINEK